MNGRGPLAIFGAMCVLAAGGAALASGPWRYTYVPRLGINVAHDMRYYTVPAVYDPERKRLAYLGYPSWGVNTGWGWSDWSPYGWWPGSAWAWPYPGDYSGDPLYEVPRRVEPRPAQSAPSEAAPAAAPVTLAELGALAMRTGDFARAAAIYERLDREKREAEAAAPVSPVPDRAALRLMALALAAEGKHAGARAALERAAREDPASSGGALDARAALGGAAALRRLVTGAVRYAHAAGASAAPGAWRYVATLMEFEGRARQAGAMRRRADELERRKAAPAPRPAAAAPGPASFRMPAPAEMPRREAAPPAPVRE